MDIQATLQATARARRRLQVMYIAYALVYAAAFALSFFVFWAALLVALGNGAFYFTVLRPLTKRYQRDFIENTLRYGLCGEMQRFVYNGAQAVSREVLKELPLLPDGNVLCREGFGAHCGVLSLAGNEISLHYSVPQPGKAKPDYRFWSGTLLELCWPGQGQGQPLTVLVDRRLADATVLEHLQDAGVAPCPLEDAALAERFVLLQPDGAPALAPPVWRRIKSLAKVAPGNFALCLQGQRLAVFLSGRFYAQKILVKYPVSEAALRGDRLPERDALLALARCCAGAEN